VGGRTPPGPGDYSGRKLNEQQEVRFDLGGRSVAGVHWQRSDAEPVIALHGWLDNAATWSRLLPLLDCYDACAIDFAGHGRSDHRPVSIAYHFIDNVADVIAVADNMGWKRFGLLGHSLGASVATLVAGTIPQRISSMVCIEGFGPLTTSAEQAPEQLQKSIARYNSGTGIVRRFDSMQQAASVRAKSTHISLSAAKILCERGTYVEDERVVWSSDPRLLYDSPMRLTEDQACAFISRISAPALLIRADNGLDYLRHVYERRMALCPQLKTTVVSGGHHPHLEEKSVADVAKAILAFHSSGR